MGGKVRHRACLRCFCFLAPPRPALRNVYRAREAALARSMELYRNSPPSAVGISPKLLPQSSPPRGVLLASYPYCVAVQELMLIPLGSCPQKKLDCIGEASSGLWAGLG